MQTVGGCAPRVGTREDRRFAHRSQKRTTHYHAEMITNPTVRKSVGGKTGNDPSAGSPTETLLRLLLPLNDKVWTASRGITAGEPATLPQSGGLTGSFNR